IAEGFIPRTSHGPKPEMVSHETLCVLNATDKDSVVRITIYFDDRDPVGPYIIKVPAQRTNHVRLNDLVDPEPLDPGKNFACIVDSEQPVVVQHTRLDSRQSENALMTTIAYGE
ncbi:MAG TPA: sensory rhodopsin transducer, partial [Cyclobacteriaceae bacterium]|nr:sensory rhodopsin transducer [Cyclobacteriaceae bacterium]